MGYYDQAMQCRWKVAHDGTGIVRCKSNVAQVEWPIEWLTVAIFDAHVLEPGLPLDR
ncbi:MULTISPECIES: hypothetical protein [unclassified Sphingobium]|uniref:hypothetical protein n=1 Tax=unclassified Sphingobium TaxID=2611147 RepID=UPI001198DD0E|nr:MULTISPECIES: hypothetical protein [unclassified Sphingobium]TWC98961.1 hypothetical protein FB595_12415 [Sphingobium sp. AEW010]TWD18480.1 hypothetical protein FB596_12545 [Sphingobium sp. AEW013]TWD21248.1 hypothetical protein FB594_12415 [Sphingobium sp. AEW001]